MDECEKSMAKIVEAKLVSEDGIIILINELFQIKEDIGIELSF